MSNPTQNNRKKLLPVAIAAVVVVALLAVTIVMRNRPASSGTGEVEVSADGASPAQDGGRAADNASRVPRSRLSGTREDAMREARQLSQQRVASKARSAERSEALRQRVATQFGAERVDPAWAPGKETSLQQISKLPQIASNIAEPTKMDVACRSSMCRIDSSFKNSGEADDWTMLYMSSVGNNLPNAVVSRVQNPDGTTSVQIYGKAR